MQKTGKPNGRPKKITAIKFEELLEGYITKRQTEGKPVLMTDFCVYAGISADTLTNYEQSPAYVGTVKKLRLYAENDIVNKALNENKPIFPIFLLKSRFGYIEQQKLDLTSNGETLGVIALPQR
jgi:hypothetical protein